MSDTPRYEANGIGVYEDGRRIGEGDGNSVEVAAQNARYIADALNGSEELLDALKRAQRLFEEALPKFDWGKSALDANAIRLLNEVPGEIRTVIASATPAAEEVGG